MQLATTFLLLAFAAYVQADRCMPCAGIVDGQTIIDVCAWDGESICHYTGGDEDDTGPYCAYYTSGPSLGVCDYSNSFSSCPLDMGTTMIDCNTCPTQ